MPTIGKTFGKRYNGAAAWALNLRADTCVRLYEQQIIFRSERNMKITAWAGLGTRQSGTAASLVVVLGAAAFCRYSQALT